MADTLKELEERQKAAEKVTLRLRLQRAGLAITPKVYWLISVLCGLGLGLLRQHDVSAVGLAPTSGVLAGIIGTFGLPRWVLPSLSKRRQAKFLAELANAIEIVVRGVKSGLPLNECSGDDCERESAAACGSEFREVVEQQRVGVALSEALERLMARMPLAEVRFLTIVIAIQQQAGGNLPRRWATWRACCATGSG